MSPRVAAYLVEALLCVGVIAAAIWLVTSGPVVVEGVVVDDDGRPVPGATVSFSLRDQRPKWETVTDDAGRFRIVGVEDRPGDLRVALDGFMPGHDDADPHEGEVEVRLRRLCRVVWDVRFQGHRPADGARVKLTCRRQGAFEGMQAVGTVSRGASRIEATTYVGRSDVWVDLDDWYSDPIPFDVRSDTRKFDAEFPLREFLTIEGIVLGPDGKPRAGCRVPGSNDHGPSARTDATGRFRLGRLKPGRVHFDVWQQDARATATFDAGDRGVELRLEPRPSPPPQVQKPGNLTIQGRVVLPGDVEWELGTIHAYRLGGGPFELLSAPIAEDGAFLLKGLRPGRHSLRARVADAVGRFASVEAGYEGVVVPMVRYGDVRGRLLGVEGRKGHVSLRRGDETSGTFGFVREDGRFSASRVEPGTYLVWARAGELATAEGTRVIVAPGDVVRDVRLKLVRGGRIEGTVRTSEGTRHAAGVWITGITGLELHLSADEQGRFVAEGLPGGRWQVHVRIGVESEPAVQEVSVRLGETSTIDITVPK